MATLRGTTEVIAGTAVTTGADNIGITDSGGFFAGITTVEGALQRLGIIPPVKQNLNATSDPAVTDDSDDGYSIGSRWINTTGDKEFVATDVTVGAALWKETTSGSTTDHGTLTGLGDNDHPQYVLVGTATTDNIKSGYQAGNALTGTAQGNQLHGGQAGYNITTGDWNVCLGNQAGYSVATGNYNFFGGYAAARNSATSASNNVVIGNSAAYDAATLNDSVVIGPLAAYGTPTSITNSIFIGNAAGYTASATTANKIYIGDGYGANGTLLQGDTSACTFSVRGNLGQRGVHKTANYTAAKENIITVDATSGAITITLPAAASSTDRIYTILKTDGSANAVTVDGDGSETINGATTYNLASQYNKVTVYCNGTAWFVI